MTDGSALMESQMGKTVSRLIDPISGTSIQSVGPSGENGVKKRRKRRKKSKLDSVKRDENGDSEDEDMFPIDLSSDEDKETTPSRFVMELELRRTAMGTSVQSRHTDQTLPKSEGLGTSTQDRGARGGSEVEAIEPDKGQRGGPSRSVTDVRGTTEEGRMPVTRHIVWEHPASCKNTLGMPGATPARESNLVLELFQYTACLSEGGSLSSVHTHSKHSRANIHTST
ncbi:phosphatidate phosphatase LPIN1 [Silurus meridionalis]|nr:phosphatidate phosphatase LPIN1 [Silurus meridionalis]